MTADQRDSRTRPVTLFFVPLGREKEQSVALVQLEPIMSTDWIRMRNFMMPQFHGAISEVKDVKGLITTR